jgi:FKBP-type peptidyl-prolyl cis-trans isomerase 2
MKRMNHILRSLSLLPVLAAALAVSCNKTSTEETNAALKRQLDAWRAIHYPDAVEKDGIYIIEETPGTGADWSKNLPVTFLTYTVRNLDGTVAANSDEEWAKQLGTWNQTYYYGQQVFLTGEGVSYAGIDVLLDGMKQGGSRTAIIPAWMCTTERYDKADEYLKHDFGSNVTSAIYTVTLMGQTPNLAKYEYDNLQQYSIQHWGVSDTLSTAAVFFKSFTEFDGEPVEMPSDTTVYITYIGRRVSDGQVFDTNIADTAKFYNIYDPSRTYAPTSVKWAETVADMVTNNKVIDGYAHGLHQMHAGEKASFAFGYNLGYGSNSKDPNMIPAYAALRFDVELVPEP